MKWKERLVANPAICHGKVCVKGTRIPVSVILDNLADGASAQRIFDSYPSLQLEDIQAVLSYAAEVARERIVDLPELASPASSIPQSLIIHARQQAQSVAPGERSAL
ncbi:MAG: hypothetical protein C1943_18780 [Halochromatium sp.]|nr:hypothetical protein [Halochromatium sp.]